MTAMASPDVFDVDFDLDVQIITDVPADSPLVACNRPTDDGCDPTCASACTSHVI